ncbi:MAG: hypothetical protein ACK5Z5_00555 [Neisseriaceae bacterium]
MNIVSQYINAISLVYNKPDSFASIVGEQNNVLYLSDAWHKLVCSDIIQLPTTLDGYDQIDPDSILEIKIVNNKILKTGKITKFIYIGKRVCGDFALLRGTKYPIYEASGKAVAVLTIQRKLKSVNINTTGYGINEYCYELENHDLNHIEQLILFYASLGFSHGESFQFITKFTNSKLKFENFKYYGKQLLKKFDSANMKELIDSVSELRECRFIPSKLLKSSIFLIRS